MNPSYSPRFFPIRPTCVFGPLMGIAALLTAPVAPAQTSGSWNVDAAGNWGTATSWLSSTIATGAGQTATLANDLTADRTVTLDAPRTIGNLLFGDVSAASAATWTIAPAAAQILTLDNSGNLPVITVDTLGAGKLAIINTPLAGTAGFQKAGPATLRLGAANPGLSGPLEVAHGRLILNQNGALGGMTSITVLPNAAIVGGSGPGLEIAGNITAGTGTTLTLKGEASPDLRSSLLGNGNSTWEGTTIVGGDRPALHALNTGTPFNINGPVKVLAEDPPQFLFIRGAGLGVINSTVDLGALPLLKTDGGSWRINSTGHTWGNTVTADGVLQMGAANVLPATSPLVLGQASGTIGRFDLNGFSQTVGGLRTDSGSTAAASQIIRNFSATPATLTDIEPDGSLNVYKGTILPNVQLVKSGPGTLQLEGSLDHLGTTVTSGPLNLFTNGSIRQPSISVQAAGNVVKSGTGFAHVNLLQGEGTVAVNEGILSLEDGHSTTAITVSGPGATAAFGSQGGELRIGSLTAGVSPEDSVNLNFTVDSSATPPVSVENNNGFTVNGPTTVNILTETVPIAPGSHILLTYTGTIGGSGFAGLTLGQTPHLTASLQHDAANRAVKLNVTAVDTLRWTGFSDGTWNLNDSGLDNFQQVSNNTTTSFYQGDQVLFDDTGLNTTITAGPGILAGNLTFNNSSTVPYQINGTFGGGGRITKTNDGTLTLSSANTFSGAVTVSGGFLKPGNGAALGTIGNSTEIQGGTTAVPGGTLDINGQNLGKEPVIISGVGSGTAGTIINTGAAQQNALRRLTLLDNATVGGTVRWDVRSQNEGGDFIDLAGKKLTKIGVNQVSAVGVNVTSGDIDINEGIFSIETTSTVQGSGTITVNPAGTLGIWTLGDGNLTRPVILNGGILNELGSGVTAIVDSPVALAADSSVGAGTAASTLRLDGVISGSAALTKINAGVVALNAANTYSGSTTISAGILRIGTGGTTGSPGSGPVVNDATLDFRRSDTALVVPNAISGSGAVTLNGAIGSVITLTGSNSFTGGVTATVGGMRITNSAGLGTGTKIINLTNGTAGKPQLRLDGSTGDISLPAEISFQTSNNDAVNSVIVNEAGNNTIAGTITLTSGGGGSYIRSDGGLLTLAGNIAPNTSGRTLHLAGDSSGILSGNLNNNGANVPTLEKLGTGTWILSGTTNTYTGTTTVIGGRLVVDGIIKGANLTVNSGTTLAGQGTAAPGGTSVAAVNGRLSPGSVSAAGASLTGTLTLGTTADTTNVNLSATTGFNYDLGAPGTAGVDYDQLMVRGTMVLGAGLIDLSDFSFITTAGFDSGTYTLAEATAITGNLGAVTTGIVGGREASLSVAGSSLILTVGNPVAGYATWASGKGLTGPSAMSDQDPDNDGAVNLLEYGADSHPSQAGSVPPLSVTSPPYTFAFTRIPAHTDLTYEVQVSTDLTDWVTVASSSGGGPTTVVVPGAATVTETGVSPVNVSVVLPQSGVRRYTRLKLRLP